MLEEIGVFPIESAVVYTSIQFTKSMKHEFNVEFISLYAE